MPSSVAIHGRDHCPNGADPIPCFGHTAWIRSQNRVIEGGGATYHNPFYIPTGTLTSGQSDIAIIKAITDEATSNEIRAYVPGIYLAEFDAEFALGFTATVDYRLSVDGGTHIPPIVTSFLNDERTKSDGSHGMNRMVFIKSATAAVPVRFSAEILQASGSDKTISDARLMVKLLPMRTPIQNP